MVFGQNNAVYIFRNHQRAESYSLSCNQIGCRSGRNFTIPDHRPESYFVLERKPICFVFPKIHLPTFNFSILKCGLNDYHNKLK